MKRDEKWSEIVCDFLFANFDFEYFVPKREVSIEDGVCNYIRFPKDENGRLVNTAILQNVIDTIENTQYSELIFGPDHTKPEVIEEEDSFYIAWNFIDMDEFPTADEDILAKYYKY